MKLWTFKLYQIWLLSWCIPSPLAACFYFYPLQSALAAQTRSISYSLLACPSLAHSPCLAAESPRGHFIINLNATPYPDKTEALARQWLPYRLDDSHIALTARNSHSSYLMDWAHRSSCIHVLLWGKGRGWEMSATKQHNKISSNDPLSCLWCLLFFPAVRNAKHS